MPSIASPLSTPYPYPEAEAETGTDRIGSCLGGGGLDSRCSQYQEVLWITDLAPAPGMVSHPSLSHRFAWYQFVESPMKRQPIRVGQWAEHSLNLYEHSSKHSLKPLQDICPPSSSSPRWESLNP